MRTKSVDDRIAWRVKRGNTSVQDVKVFDRNGNLATDLAGVSDIEFEVKKEMGGAALISASVAGGEIVVDTPTTGWIRITLSPTDTDIDKDEYFMGIKATWGATEIYRLRIFKKVVGSEIETKLFIIEERVVA